MSGGSIELERGFPARVIHRASGDAYDMIGTAFYWASGSEPKEVVVFREAGRVGGLFTRDRYEFNREFRLDDEA